MHGQESGWVAKAAMHGHVQCAVEEQAAQGSITTSSWKWLALLARSRADSTQGCGGSKLKSKGSGDGCTTFSCHRRLLVHLIHLGALALAAVAQLHSDWPSNDRQWACNN